MSQWDRVLEKGPDGERMMVPDTPRPHQVAGLLSDECDRLRSEISRLLRVCEDKERHLDGYRLAADEDRAVIAKLRAALSEVMQHAPGYDWNADPRGLTRITGAAFAAADGPQSANGGNDRPPGPPPVPMPKCAICSHAFGDHDRLDGRCKVGGCGCERYGDGRFA